MIISKPGVPVHGTEVAIAVLLTFLGGYVDAVGFLRLGGIYVANMSGNSVAVGMHLARRDWPVVLERLLPIACYVAGLLGTRIFVDFALAGRMRRVAAIFFLLETGFLLSFMHAGTRNSGILFAAVAMGIQSATLTRFDGVTVHTVFVTGSLVKMSESLSRYLVGLVRPDIVQKEDRTEAIWFIGVWLAYLAGAVAGALLFGAVSLRAVWLPCMLLVGLAVLDIFRPAEFDTSA